MTHQCQYCDKIITGKVVQISGIANGWTGWTGYTDGVRRDGRWTICVECYQYMKDVVPKELNVMQFDRTEMLKIDPQCSTCHIWIDRLNDGYFLEQGTMNILCGRCFKNTENDRLLKKRFYYVIGDLIGKYGQWIEPESVPIDPVEDMLMRL